MFLLLLAGVGLGAAQGAFWALPTQLLSPASFGVAVVAINIAGSAGGLVMPQLIGIARERSGGFTGPTLLVVAVLLTGGIPVLLLVVGATTWRLTGRALAPVEAIRTEVEGIGGGDLDRRVPVPPGGDEIARLASTMNAMLDRLEAAAVRQAQRGGRRGCGGRPIRSSRLGRLAEVQITQGPKRVLTIGGAERVPAQAGRVAAAVGVIEPVRAGAEQPAKKGAVDRFFFTRLRHRVVSEKGGEDLVRAICVAARKKFARVMNLEVLALGAGAGGGASSHQAGSSGGASSQPAGAGRPATSTAKGAIISCGFRPPW